MSIYYKQGRFPNELYGCQLPQVNACLFGEEQGKGRRWVGRRISGVFVQFEFSLMFGKLIHFCVNLIITYENNLLKQ